MEVVRLKNVGYEVRIRENYKKIILKNISLSVNSGEFHLIMGSSGSGKTTLLQIICTLLFPTSGEVSLLGKKVNVDTPPHEIFNLRKHIGYLFQSPFIPSHISIFEYVQIQSQLSGVGAKTAISNSTDILQRLEIHKFKDKKPHLLSGGERQRVALAAILARNAKLLLLDEPTGSLDQENSLNFWDILSKLKGSELAIVAASHDSTIRSFVDDSHQLRFGSLNFQTKKIEN